MERPPILCDTCLKSCKKFKVTGIWNYYACKFVKNENHIRRDKETMKNEFGKLVNAYSLNKQKQEELKTAILNSQRWIKINIANISTKQLQKIRSILNESNN